MERTHWDETRPGDTLYGVLVVSREITRKGAAQAIADSVGGSVWLDGPRTWAVCVRHPERRTPGQLAWCEAYFAALREGAGRDDAWLLADIAAAQPIGGAA